MSWVDPNPRKGETAEYGLTIAWIERLRLSYYGNPRFKVHFHDGETRVNMSDAACSYDIENMFGAGKPVDIVLSRNGRIVYIREAQGNGTGASK
jgi:hypothetical protein